MSTVVEGESCNDASWNLEAERFIAKAIKGVQEEGGTLMTDGAKNIKVGASLEHSACNTFDETFRPKYQRVWRR